MNASPLLARVVAALNSQKLEAVLIGNAAAAMQGAPVTTLDFDFMFRDTPTNLRKLKAVAASLDAMILRPFYPVSKLYRVVDDASGLQADFMPVIHGVRSFEGLRSRATQHAVGKIKVKVASLPDIIASKKAAGRDRDNPHLDGAVPDMPAKKPRSSARRKTLDAMRKESDRQLEELIRRRLAMPIEQRMNFLRKRLPGGGSCL
jgi:hypothetical protein